MAALVGRFRAVKLLKRVFCVNRAMYSTSSERPFTVLVEGNIGSGKTTYLEHFRQFEDVSLFSEPVETWRDVNGWNLLDMMYKDPDKWAMPFQSYVTLTMLKEHLNKGSTKVKMMERSIFSARYCFVENMHKKNIIHPANYSVLDQWFQFVTSNMDISADLIVYLKTTPAIAYERIKKRARCEEECVPLEYIKDLHEMHENWLVKGLFKRPAPVLILDANLDLAFISEEYKKSEHEVLKEVMNVVINATPKKSSSKN